jgi:putative endonuclease
MKPGTVYIMSSPKRSTLYVGVTADLNGRVWEHKNKIDPKSFTARYNCVMLVYYSDFSDIENAIDEEKRLKGSSRRYKEQLIDEMKRMEGSVRRFLKIRAVILGHKTCPTELSCSNLTKPAYGHRDVRSDLTK